MKVWVEGRKDAEVTATNVFSSLENLLEYWRCKLKLTGPTIDALRRDAKSVLNGTLGAAGIGVIAFDEELGTVPYAARPVEVDEWFINKTKENNNGNTSNGNQN